MSEPILITDAAPGEIEECTRIKVDKGLELDRLSEISQRWIERKFDSPTTLYDEPVPWRFWKCVRDYIDRQVRGTLTDHFGLREDREVALAFVRSLVKNRVNAMTPMRAQLDFYDLMCLASPTGRASQGALRCFREAVYVCFNNEWLGRGVG